MSCEGVGEGGGCADTYETASPKIVDARVSMRAQRERNPVVADGLVLSWYINTNVTEHHARGAGANGRGRAHPDRRAHGKAPPESAQGARRLSRSLAGRPPRGHRAARLRGQG